MTMHLGSLVHHMWAVCLNLLPSALRCFRSLLLTKTKAGMLRSSIALSQVINLIDLIALDVNPICPGNYICIHMMYEMSEHEKGK